jgi:hypothetical protein
MSPLFANKIVWQQRRRSEIAGFSKVAGVQPASCVAYAQSSLRLHLIRSIDFFTRGREDQTLKLMH